MIKPFGSRYFWVGLFVVFVLGFFGFVIDSVADEVTKDKVLESKAKTKDADYVIAVVNGKPIRLSDVIYVLDSQFGSGGMSAFMFVQMSSADKKEFLDELLNVVVFAVAAQREGLDKDPSVARKLKWSRNFILTQEYIKKVSKNWNITDNDLKAYYKKYSPDFKQQEQVHVAHILVKNEDEAKNILEELKKGASFDVLAQKYSIDPATKNKGGDLGWFGRGKMVKEFEEAAFSLKKPGDISGVVKTNFGYHILLLKGKKEAVIPPFNDVRERVFNAVYMHKVRELAEKLRKEYDVKYTEDGLRLIQ